MSFILKTYVALGCFVAKQLPALTREQFRAVADMHAAQAEALNTETARRFKPAND